jgi:lipooligosaccharide transport system ATP-binding protein
MLGDLARHPDHGRPESRARPGVVPQDDNTELLLAGGVYHPVYGRYFGLPRDEIRRRTDELLEFVQLADRRESRVDSFSGGMKRRLTIARALINEPELMLLDEPTTGLDPQARHALWDRLYRLKQRGVTLVLTTHYMDEAEQLCDRLVVMDRAKIVAEGSPRELIERYVEREVVELRFADRNGGPSFEGLADHVEVLQDRVVIGTDDGDAVVDEVHARGLRPETVLVRRSTLEDVFLRLTGRSLVD